jgi:uncharacterized membrane protein YgcG
MTQQTYLVLLRDARVALAVAAALQDRLADHGHHAMALVPSRGSVGCDTPADAEYLRHAAGPGGIRPRVVATYEDGLFAMLKPLGLCAYVGVRRDQDWRVLRWGDHGGAMLLPVSTARELVEAVASHTQWDAHASNAGVAVSLADPAARRSRILHVGQISRRVAAATVVGPLLAFGLPVAAAAAQTAAPQAQPSGGSATNIAGALLGVAGGMPASPLPPPAITAASPGTFAGAFGGVPIAQPTAPTADNGLGGVLGVTGGTSAGQAFTGGGGTTGGGGATGSWTPNPDAAPPAAAAPAAAPPAASPPPAAAPPATSTSQQSWLEWLGSWLPSWPTTGSIRECDGLCAGTSYTNDGNNSSYTDFLGVGIGGSGSVDWSQAATQAQAGYQARALVGYGLGEVSGVASLPDGATAGVPGSGSVSLYGTLRIPDTQLRLSGGFQISYDPDNGWSFQWVSPKGGYSLGGEISAGRYWTVPLNQQQNQQNPQSQDAAPASAPNTPPQNSAINPDGTPVQGQPGTQSGPAATPPADNTSGGSSAINPDGTPVQGQPGTQSGPAATPPADATPAQDDTSAPDSSAAPFQGNGGSSGGAGASGSFEPTPAAPPADTAADSAPAAAPAAAPPADITPVPAPAPVSIPSVSPTLSFPSATSALGTGSTVGSTGIGSFGDTTGIGSTSVGSLSNSIGSTDLGGISSDLGGVSSGVGSDLGAVTSIGSSAGDSFGFSGSFGGGGS